jgi:hypothetical protein
MSSLYIGLALFYPVESRVLRIGYGYNGITVEVYSTENSGVLCLEKFEYIKTKNDDLYIISSY